MELVNHYSKIPNYRTCKLGDKTNDILPNKGDFVGKPALWGFP